MAAASSTSNSDGAKPRDNASASAPAPAPPKCGVPYALIGALLIVVVVELLLRTIPREKLIAYASDYGQYQAVRDYIDLKGPTEVALVGSSQVREGVHMPTLKADLEQQLGREVSVANYAVRGARVEFADAVVRHLQRQPTPPKLIVVGLATRDLREMKPEYERLTVFWDFEDWWREFRSPTGGWARTGQLPAVIRNYAGDALLTLKHRETMQIQLARLFAPLGVKTPHEPNPILGEVTFQHLGGRGERTLHTAVQLVPMKKMLQGAISTQYLPNPQFLEVPPPLMRERLASLVSQFTTPEARSRGLVVEMPIARELFDEIENRRWHMVRGFNQQMTRSIAGTPLRYVPTSEQPFKPGKDHFSDLQHFNRPGAQEFSRWLAGEIAFEMTGKRERIYTPPAITGPATSPTSAPSMPR